MAKAARPISHNKAATSWMTVGRNDDIDLCRVVTMAIVTKMRSRDDSTSTKHRYDVARCRRPHGRES